MKYKIGDEVLVKAKIITGVRKYFGVEVEDNRFDVCEDDIVPVPEMTAEEAWELAGKIVLLEDEGGIPPKDMVHMFGVKFTRHIIKEYSVQEVKAKIEAWEAEKEIKVGDEVDICGDKGIVTSFGTDGDADKDVCNKNIDVLKIAISAMQELMEYKQLGALEEVQDAVERQRAKKAILDKPIMILCCPSCGSYLQKVVDDEGSTEGFIPMYCKDCGQKIDADWSEEK